MRLRLIHESVHDDGPTWGWSLGDDGLWHKDGEEPIELLHDAEHALQKFVPSTISPDIVGYKICGQHLTKGQDVYGYVLAGLRDSELVDFYDSGSYGGNWLLVVKLPKLGQRSTQQRSVSEWGNPARYPAGNPGLTATSVNVKPGDEILLLVPGIVIECYQHQGRSHDEVGVSLWRSDDGKAIRTKM